MKAEAYDYFLKEWLRVRDEYAIKKGIHNFWAYITYRLGSTDKRRQKKQTRLNLPKNPQL